MLSLTPTPLGIWLPISSGYAKCAAMKMAGLRRLLGLDLGAGLRPSAPRACIRAGAAWYFLDHRARYRLVLPIRRLGNAPRPLARLFSAHSEAERGNLVQAYHKRLTGTDKAEQLVCAKAWSQWEGATANLIARPESIDSFGEDHFAIAFARIENHFFVNHCWLEENQLLRDAHKLHGIPGVIVHGRYDMPCPLRNAWQLAQAWPDATLNIIEAAGHSMSEPAILSAMIEALDGFGITE